MSLCHPTRRHTLRSAAGLALGCLVLGTGCSDADLPPGSLFVRQPDALLEEQGRIAPTTGAGWGEGGEGDWHTRTTAIGGELLCWSKGRRAYLELHSLGPLDRVLRLRAASVEGGASTVHVVLGDHDLGTFPLTPKLAWIDVPAPAVTWAEGSNLLLLEVEHTAPHPQLETVGLGIAEVAWAEPRRVVSHTDRIELAPGTGLVYHLTGVGEQELAVSASTLGDGALTLTFGAFDPVDSSVAPSGAGVTLLPDEHGRIAWRRRLDSVATAFSGDTGSMRLQWVGDTVVTLEALGLEHEATSPAPRRPNVVFVSVDTLAARHLSCYGYARETTPNIDRLAKRSIVFEGCMANAPWTAPSYLSQLSGLYPVAHEIETAGVAEPQGWEANHLAASRWTWAESLRSAGYTTAAWVDNPWVSAGMGMAQGFDVFDTSAAEIYLSDTSGGFAHILPRAIEWIGAQRAPFFAFLQPMDTHGPYFTKWRYRDRWDRDGVYDANRRVPVGYEQLHAWSVVPEYIAWGERKGLGRPPPLVRSEPYQNAYDEKIAEVDDYFGRLLDFLERSGILDNSIVVFSSDHGEAVGEHEYWFDHGILYDEVLRVPLIVHMPGDENAGRRVATPVQLVDLMPTVLDLAGLPVPDHLHGRSLAPAMRGEPLKVVPIYSHGGIAEQASMVFGADKLLRTRPATGSYQTILSSRKLAPERIAEVAPELVDTDWSNAKYADWVRANSAKWERLVAPIQGDFDELFDLERDPLEQSDLAQSGAARLRSLEQLLATEQARGVASQARAQRTTRPMAIGDDVRRRLEALGYLAPNSGATPVSSDE